MKVGVLGAGAWGTALADLLARAGHDVTLWAYEPEVAAAITERHENPVYLAGIALSPTLKGTADAVASVHGAELILSVSPSHATRSVLGRVRDAVPAGTPVVSATKGLELDSLALMSDVVAEELPHAQLVVLSGPSFALEVAQGQPTAVVAASASLDAAALVQRAFGTPRFRVYTGTDVVGAELGGALKNVMAVAAGMLEGLGLGDNPRAALLTRGLAEITRLGTAMGADPLTFAGLAGMGDLVLTCCGALSRNRQLGVAVARGTTLEQWRATHRTVAEGANAARAAVGLAARFGVELPIAEQVRNVLFEGTSAQDCVAALMERSPKAEVWR
jgi:glycerol-3-phosphate dehydrogenase (NAD(P)+)